ncbi:MAG: polysaccharide biosynthesis/export family protein [Cyanobacteria bacterium P01_F01_bin.4]
MSGYRINNLRPQRLHPSTGIQPTQMQNQTTWLGWGRLALALCLSAMGLTVTASTVRASTLTPSSFLGEKSLSEKSLGERSLGEKTLGDTSEVSALDAALDELADASDLPDLEDAPSSDSEDVPEGQSPDEPLEGMDAPEGDVPESDLPETEASEPDISESDGNEILPQVDIVPSTQGPFYDGLNNAPLGRGDRGFTETAFDQYRLGPGDSVFVSVQRFPDLSFQATLDLQGEVILPIQGAVPLVGLSLEEAESRISQVYNQYVVIREVADPGYRGPKDVTLTLVAQRGVEVTILGEVERPGFYPLPEPRVSTALLIAGGASNSADLRELQVQRRLSSGEVISTTVDLFTPIREGQALPDLRLENGDVITIPRLDPATLDGYDRTLVANSTLAQPQITVRILNYAAGGRGGSGTLGTLNLENGSNFVDAITQMGINPDRARLGSVALFRFDPETGDAVELDLDAKDAFRGDPTQNPPLQDDDVIIVGRNFVSRLSFALDTVTRPFRDVLGFLLFVDGVFDTNVFD